MKEWHWTDIWALWCSSVVKTSPGQRSVLKVRLTGRPNKQTNNCKALHAIIVEAYENPNPNLLHLLLSALFKDHLSLEPAVVKAICFPDFPSIVTLVCQICCRPLQTPVWSDAFAGGGGAWPVLLQAALDHCWLQAVDGPNVRLERALQWELHSRARLAQVPGWSWLRLQ